MSNTIGPNETTEEPIMSAEIRTIIETLSVMSISNHLLTFTDFLTINFVSSINCNQKIGHIVVVVF